MKSLRRLNFSHERHTHINWLHDVILGGQDGLVNVLGIVLGVSAASGDNKVLVAASLAAAFAEAVSMGAVAYTSTLSERDYYLKELARENHEIETSPEKETEEIRKIYQNKGFSGQLLNDIVKEITSDSQVWIQTMMQEELGLHPVETSTILRTSAIVTLAALVAALVPIIPFMFLPRSFSIPVSLLASGVVLFGIGVYEAKVYTGKWWKSGLQMLIIGLGAAVIGFFIGKIFSVN